MFLLVTVLSLAGLVVVPGQADNCVEESFGVTKGIKVDLPARFIPPTQKVYWLHIPYYPKCDPIGLVVRDCENSGDASGVIINVMSVSDAKVVRFVADQGAYVKPTLYCYA